MNDEPTLFASAGVAMPARPRPKRTDTPVLRVAATAFAVQVVRDHSDVVEEDPEEFADNVMAVMPIQDHDGFELSQALNRRYGYALDRAMFDAMEGWSGHLDAAHRKAVEAWVSETVPPAPFEDVVKASTTSFGKVIEGVAYRSGRTDATAQCLFVGDDEVGRFVTDGAFAGGRVVAWEDVTVLGEPGAEDRDRFEARLAAEAKSERRALFGRFAGGLRNVFDEMVSSAAKEMASLSPEDRKALLTGALARMAGDARGGVVDAVGKDAACVVAVLGVEREASYRRDFERAMPAR